MKLNLPEYEHRFRERNGTREIFDPVRGKYVALTPEEWVRQNFVKYLIAEKKVPKGLISIEMTLSLNDTVKRSDIVVYDNRGNPLSAVECKAPSITIKQSAFDQLARYNSVLRVPYLIVTNGVKHYYCKLSECKTRYVFIPDLPEYNLMRSD